MALRWAVARELPHRPRPCHENPAGTLAFSPPARGAAGERVWVGVCARAIWSSATRFPLRLLDSGGPRGFPILRPLAIHPLGHQRFGRCAVQAGAVLTDAVVAYSVAWAVSFQVFVAFVLPDVPWLGAARSRLSASRRSARVCGHDSIAARTGWRGIHTLAR